MSFLSKVRTVPISLVSATSQGRLIDPPNYKVKSRAFQNLKPESGEKILDIGCRDGFMSMQIKDMGCQVLGIDINPAMVEAARQKGLEALLMDAEEMFFDKEFDAAFSLSALHWMRHPDLVLEAVNRALKMQGRFVAEMSAYGNLQTLFDAFLEVLQEQGKTALYLIPWYLPTEADYRERLEKKGFTVRKMETNRKFFGVNGSLSTFVQSFVPIFSAVAGNRQELVDLVVRKLEDRLNKRNGLYQVEYVSIDFIAVKEKEIV